MAFDIKFNEEKNQLLKATREISFEDILEALKMGKLLADIAHPSQKYPRQRLYVVKIKEYAYAVPYISDSQKKEIFLKTIYPSRILTRIYLKGGKMKKIKSNNPFTNLVLDEEEKLLEQSLERGEFEENPHSEDIKNMLQEAASLYLELHNSKPVTLRINQLDLIRIKAKAKQKQIPYQTLLGALLHDFAEGKKKLSL